VNCRFQVKSIKTLRSELNVPSVSKLPLLVVWNLLLPLQRVSVACFSGDRYEQPSNRF
jgi:hypothetical protein